MKLEEETLALQEKMRQALITHPNYDNILLDIFVQEMKL